MDHHIPWVYIFWPLLHIDDPDLVQVPRPGPLHRCWRMWRSADDQALADDLRRFRGIPELVASHCFQVGNYRWGFFGPRNVWDVFCIHRRKSLQGSLQGCFIHGIWWDEMYGKKKTRIWYLGLSRHAMPSKPWFSLERKFQTISFPGFFLDSLRVSLESCRSTTSSPRLIEATCARNQGPHLSVSHHHQAALS